MSLDTGKTKINIDERRVVIVAALFLSERENDMLRNKTVSNKGNETGKIESLRRKLTGGGAGLVALETALLPQMAQASGFDGVINGINQLKTLLLTVVGAAGVIVVIMAVVKIASSLSAHDTSQISGGIMQLVGGLLMAGVAGFLAVMGLS